MVYNFSMPKVIFIFVCLFFLFCAEEEIFSQETLEQSTQQSLSKSYFKEALDCLKKEDYHQAKEFFWKALELEQDNPDAYINLGIISLKEGNIELALHFFAQVEGRFPQYPKKEILYYNMGLAHFLNTDYRQAQEYFLKALSIYPDFGEPLYYLGKCYDFKGQAEDAFLSVIKAKNIFARKNQRDFYNKAVEFLSDLEKRYVKDNLSLANKLLKEGEEALNNNETKRALILFEEALALKPEAPRAYYMLGIFYLKEKSLANALTYFKQATKYEPNYWDAWLYIGEIYARTENYEEAFKIFEEILRKDKKNKRALYDLGMLYLKLGKKGKAEAYFEEFKNLGGTAQNTVSILSEEPKKSIISLVKGKRSRTATPSQNFYIISPEKKNRGIFVKGYYIGQPSLEKNPAKRGGF